MVNGISTQHYTWWFWGWPVLSGPVERRSGQTVQLWRPGHLDSDRCSSDRSWLCGTCWRFSLHLKQSSGDMAEWFVLSSPSHRFTLKDWRSEMLCSWHVCLPELAVQHVLIPSANRQEVFSSLHQRCLYPHNYQINPNHCASISCWDSADGSVQRDEELVIMLVWWVWFNWWLGSVMLIYRYLSFPVEQCFHSHPATLEPDLAPPLSQGKCINRGSNGNHGYRALYGNTRQNRQAER